MKRLICVLRGHLPDPTTVFLAKTVMHESAQVKYSVKLRECLRCGDFVEIRVH